MDNFQRETSTQILSYWFIDRFNSPSIEQYSIKYLSDIIMNVWNACKRHYLISFDFLKYSEN